MSSLDLLSMGVRNLIKRKLRTFLTVLGVMIGTASIVVMVSLGLAINEQYAKQIEEMGDMTLIEVRSYGGMRMGPGAEAEVQSEAPQINDETMAAIEKLPGVVAATPVLQGNVYFKSGEYIMDAWQCIGMKPEAMPLLGFETQQGQLLTSESDKYDVVFGAYAETYFRKGNRYEDRYWDIRSGAEYKPYVDVFEDRIRMSPDSNFIYAEDYDPSVEVDDDDVDAPQPITPYDVNVVGLLTTSENENDQQYDQVVLFNVETLKELIQEGREADQSNMAEWGHFSARRDADEIPYDTAYVKCVDLEATKEINKILREEMFFNTYYQGERIESSQETAQLLQVLLAAIGGVSLFVAAIGIANTMVMSIYERTREIGVMKVIGASIRDIKWLFLLESALIGFLGGITGVGLSLLVSYLLNNASMAAAMNSEGGSVLSQILPMGGGDGTVSLITPWLCGATLGFSSAVGLVSGYFPARRATKLSALSAIRTE